MTANILDYLRRNVIALTALGCALLALGGASYAAFRVPKGSVGTAQLRNGSVTNTKLARGVIGGYVRAWASTNLAGQTLGSSGPVKVRENGALLRFTWQGRFPRHQGSCTPIATPTGLTTSPSGANPSLTATWSGGNGVNVYLDLTAEEKAVSVALIC